MKPARSSHLGTFALALGLSTFAACTEQPSSPQPATLGDVQVPPSFTFATTKAVALSVSATSEKIGGAQGALSVERADGKVLFRGPIEASKPLAVKLMIPSKDDALRLRLSSRDGELTSDVPVAAGSATYQFE